MEKNEKLHNVRHSAAHLLAEAVVELFPGTKLTIGPVTDTGFFYDFLPVKNFKENDLPVIEEKMREIAKRNHKIEGSQIPKDEARPLFKDNEFKQELIDTVEGDTVGVYYQGEFYDLCKGGHTRRTGDVKHFRLTGISGSYWRADRDGTALQRISGICFATKQDFDDHLQRLEDAQKYDHRRLGKQMDLFTFHEEAPGMPFFHHKGLVVYNKLIDYLRHLHGVDYQEIRTPQVLNEQLWKTSGHYDNYKEHMYFTSVEDVNFCVKPMNCPGSILLYKERPHSYRELPLRLAEFGLVHRFELSGVMHGLFRVRSFTIDDAHVYCSEDQIESEVEKMLQLAETVYKKFGFDNLHIGVSTRPEKYIGTLEGWDKATESLKKALDNRDMKYTIQEGEGAFYGPKIELIVKDAMDREWQCGTVQVDFFQSENFDLDYIDSDQSKKKPVIIHRAIYGSIERFFGIILEHFKGNVPFWIAPVQLRVMTITDEQRDYAGSVLDRLLEAGLRAEMSKQGDQISAQIKAAQVEKIPWMLVIGKKEVENNTVTLRHLDGKQEFGLSLDDVVQRATELNEY